MSFSLIIHGGAGSGSKSLFTRLHHSDNIFENMETLYKDALYNITAI